ncbi:MAG: hypothetical protein K0R18_1001 [Bacillales bacterium]|jgi:hypothetical protein|nr:hypothetical protein [Bacillales bacterium]
MKILKTSWYLWWGWNPEKVESWLELMEEKGWNLYQVDMMATRFKFKKDESKKVRYCVDYQSNIESQYIKIFNDDGWELVWSDDFGWYIWKKVYINERPSIYTDYISLIDRNNRLINVLKPIFFLLIFFFIFLIIPMIDTNFFKFLFWFYIFILSLYTLIFYQIKKYNKKLKENTIRE